MQVAESNSAPVLVRPHVWGLAASVAWLTCLALLSLWPFSTGEPSWPGECAAFLVLFTIPALLILTGMLRRWRWCFALVPALSVFAIWSLWLIRPRDFPLLLALFAVIGSMGALQCLLSSKTKESITFVERNVLLFCCIATVCASLIANVFAYDESCGFGAPGLAPQKSDLAGMWIERSPGFLVLEFTADSKLRFTFAALRHRGGSQYLLRGKCVHVPNGSDVHPRTMSMPLSISADKQVLTQGNSVYDRVTGLTEDQFRALMSKRRETFERTTKHVDDQP